MIRYQLSTGKTVMLTADQLLNLTEQDIQELVAADRGIDVNDPFTDFNISEGLNLESIPDDEIKRIEKEFNDENQ